jgi:hypothetical protein
LLQADNVDDPISEPDRLSTPVKGTDTRPPILDLDWSPIPVPPAAPAATTLKRPGLLSKELFCSPAKKSANDSAETHDSDTDSPADDSDKTWAPDDTLNLSYQEDEFGADNDTDEEAENENESKDIKVVFAEVTQLEILLKNCRKCNLPNKITKTRRGAHVTFHCRCPKGHRFDWQNAKYASGQPVLNILIAAAVLCSGVAFASFNRFVACIGLAAISKSTFERKVDNNASPVLQNEWFAMKNSLLQNFQSDSAKIKVCGDARFDSPGKFSAKYCIYTLMTTCGKIVDYIIYQKGLMPGEMEAKSFKLVFSRLLQDYGKDKISIFCSDRNMSVAKIMRESFSRVAHAFDVNYEFILMKVS